MSDEVKMIPIERIRILNPRQRDQKKFELIVQSIKNLGLKMPVQISLCSENEPEGPGYDLICGQGRIEAFTALGYRVVLASMRLLNGIHDEAAELLKDKNIAPKAIRLLKRVNGVRQIEIAELMVAANNFFTGYAEALVLGTPKDQLVNPDEPKNKKGMSAEDIAKMEQEMESLERDLKNITENYTENMFNLTCARGYIKKLLENAKVVRFFNTNHPDIFPEFEAIAATESL